MNIRISREFEKSAKKLSGKYKESLKKTILEIKLAKWVDEINNCKKLTGYSTVFRIRMGDYRIFFLFEIIENTICLKYLVHRGEAYGKAYQNKLKKEDK